MKTKLRFAIAVALCLFAMSPERSRVSAAETRPNILFFFADDQRTDTIAAHGNPRIDTPHLDQLAQCGVSFRRNYCMGSIHGAVCQPSRAMLLSGRGLYHVKMDLSGSKTFPELLHEHGYQTFITGKWHNGQESLQRCFESGRAVFLGGMSDHTKVPVSDLREGQLVNARIGDRFSSELFADAAIEFLRDRDARRPFLAYVSFTAPHDPRQPPESYREKYYQRNLPLPANFLPQHPFFNGWMTGRDETLAPWPRTEQIVRDQLAEYYGMVTHLDEQVGRILSVLQSTGQTENTIVIYAADHGLAIGSHGLLGKQSLYEHSMRCPLIFCGPGIPANKQSTALTYLLDIYPTICELAGIPSPPELDGQSLEPLWTGEHTQVRETLFTAYEGSMRAIRDRRWKLIRYPHIHFTQLFDLDNDPHEMRNLADRPEYAERTVQMLDQLRQWQQETGDTQPLSDPEPISKEINLQGTTREPDDWQPDWIRRKYFGVGDETDTEAQK